jgi:crotonobetainyl-CoA:carnitine CoA-transferase CaiB-like acyl-CoA transferase
MLPLANTPFRFSRSESGITGRPRDLGEDTAAVLLRLRASDP